MAVPSPRQQRAVQLLRDGIIQLGSDGHPDLANALTQVADELVARNAEEGISSHVTANVEPTPASQISRLESFGKDVTAFLDDWMVRAEHVVREMDSAAQTNSSAAGEMARAANQMREAAGTILMARPR